MSSGNGTRSTEQACNISEALEDVDGDMEILEEIAGLFLEDYSAQFDQIGNGISRGDAVAVNRTAPVKESKPGADDEAVADLETTLKELKGAMNAALK